MDKIIYMTYKKNVPDIVFKRWLEHNKEYSIDFSLDENCKNFRLKGSVIFTDYWLG